jgi:hypothetical protein
MVQRLVSRLERHWDILIFLVSTIFICGMMYAQNTDAIASLALRTEKTEKKVEALSEVKEDVSAIKQKVDDIWDIMQHSSRHD